VDLDPGLTVTTVTRTYAVASAFGTQVEIRQIPLPGQQIPAGSTQVVRGQVSPYQGWVSHGALQRIPAPVVTMTRSGSRGAILTLLVPGAPGVFGGRQLAFLVSPGGDIKAG
jgi:hypothetical protein